MSRKSIPYWHVDAFASRPFEGNQAAVVVVEKWPDDRVMMAIAAENMFAETAFLVATPDAQADYALRWFTPSVEVALCGHATLASGHVLLAGSDTRDAVTFSTRKAGVLEVRRADEGYALGLPAIATEPGEFPEAVAHLGAKPMEVWRNRKLCLVCMREGHDSSECRLTADEADEVRKLQEVTPRLTYL